MYYNSSESIVKEIELRKNLCKSSRLVFGISYLDESLYGIGPGDLVLLGAPSGVGKTQLCVNIALSNLENGKRVHFIALEASEYEIEQRLKFQLISNMYFKDECRPKLAEHLSYSSWYYGANQAQLFQYEDLATEYLSKALKDLNVYYKTNEDFNLEALIKAVILAKDESDLFIIDHVHYFDIEDSDNENRALKLIAKTVRDLALMFKKAIILVAHLRKRDRFQKDLVPGIDEFHGSSDLTKIATKVITMAPGSPDATGHKFKTYFRVVKNRMDGGVTRYIAEISYDVKKMSYESSYLISSTKNPTEFKALSTSEFPKWALSAKEDYVLNTEPSIDLKGIQNYATKYVPYKD